MTVKGFHIMADLHGCKPGSLGKSSSLRQALFKAADKAGFTVLGEKFHQFKPAGATGFLLLAQSHISAHSWPEHDFIAIDIYSCSGKEKAMKALEECISEFEPKKKDIRAIDRFL